MPKALLLENIHPLGRQILESTGFEVVARSGALDEAELAEALDGVSLLGIRSKTQVTAEVLAAAPDLLAVAAVATLVSAERPPELFTPLAQTPLGDALERLGRVERLT